MNGIGKVTIHLSKTADGAAFFVQVSSPAAMPVNIVLLATEVEIDDQREMSAPTPKRRKRR